MVKILKKLKVINQKSRFGKKYFLEDYSLVELLKGGNLKFRLRGGDKNFFLVK